MTGRTEVVTGRAPIDEIDSAPELDDRWFAARPTRRLGSIVDGYLDYRQRNGEPGLHRGLPSGSLTFIVSIGEPIEIVHHPNGAQSPAEYRTTLAGLHSSPALIRHDGNQQGVAISLDPIGARDLLGIPAAALAGESIEFDELVGSIGRELSERVNEADDADARFAACDDVLTRLANRSEHEPVAPELRAAWRNLTGSGGRASIGELADASGWSGHHLARRFRSEFGISPKRAARIVRFERSCTMLKTPGHLRTLAAVAVECGYYDQSHMTNEWSDFAGCSPTAWCASEHVPFFQDESHASG